jgi:phage shock protein PspC (stress-responsive transcriptional regulator)
MSSIWTVRRSATDHKVSGLSAGLARAWNVDPMLVRVGFAVLALSGGIGLVLYAAGWLMLPVEGKEQSQLEEWLPQTRTWSREVKVGVVVAACVIGAIALSWLVPFSFTAALVVAAIWYFGYYRTRQHRPQHTSSEAPQLWFAEFPGQPTPFTEAAKAWQQRIAEYQRLRVDKPTYSPPSHAPSPAAAHAAFQGGPRSTSSAPSAATASAAADPERDLEHEAFFAHPDPVGLYSEPAPDTSAIEQLRRDRRLRRRSARRLGLVSLVVLGLTMTGLGIASAAGAPISVGVYLSSALLIFGLTLLAGARFGRPPGLAFSTVLVALAMIISLVAPNNTTVARDIGIRRVEYASAADLPSADHLRFGQLTVDLRHVRPDFYRTYNASVDTGRLVVYLPADGLVNLNGQVGQGMIKVDNQKFSSGPRLQLHQPAPTNTQKPVLTVNLRVNNGELDVRR